MLSNITIGQYFPGDSFLHRMDPRAKIVATMIFIIAIFLAETTLAYTVALSRLPMRLVWNSVKPLWIIIVFTMGVHVFTTPGTMIWQYGFLHIS